MERADTKPRPNQAIAPAGIAPAHRPERHRPILNMTRLNIRLANAKSTERAVQCELQLQAFRKKPALVRFLLGSFLTRAFLELRADLALEDYLNEAMTWH